MLGVLGIILITIPSAIFFLLYIVFYNYGRRYVSPIKDFRYQDELVSIIIPVRKEPLELMDDALRKLSEWRNTRLEIILISDDELRDFEKIRELILDWRSRGLNIVLMWREEPRGFRSGALNDALGVVRGRYLYIMDVDSRLNESFIHKAVALIKRGVVAVVARWTGKNMDSRIAEAIAASMKFVVDALYRGRSSLGLPVFPVGTGTVYNTEFIKNVLKGWDERRIQDDMDIGVRIMRLGGKILFIDDEPVYVEVPRRYRSLRIQQERWSYGATDVAITRFWDILRSPQPWYAKLEAYYFLLQYLPASLVFFGFILLSVSAFSLVVDMFSVFWWLGLPWLIFAAIYSYLYIRSLGEMGYSRWMGLVNLGRSAAITTALTPTLTAAIFRALIRRPFVYKRTPKGSLEGIRSSYRVPWELLFGLFILSVGVYELVLGLTYTGIWSITYSLGYIYVCIRFIHDVLHR